MGKVATGGGEPRELVPARTYLGVVCGVFDIGTQDSGSYGPKPQFVVMFELHTRKGPARDKAGNIMTISTFVNFYLGSRARPSNLLELIEALENRTLSDEEIKKGFDVETLLGKACQVQVIHRASGAGEMKARVDKIMALDPDDTAPRGELDEEYFELKPGSKELPEKLPKFVAEMVKKSQEWTGKKSPSNGEAKRQPVGAGVGGGSDDEDIPF